MALAATLAAAFAIAAAPGERQSPRGTSVAVRTQGDDRKSAMGQDEGISQPVAERRRRARSLARSPVPDNPLPRG